MIISHSNSQLPLLKYTLALLLIFTFNNENIYIKSYYILPFNYFRNFTYDLDNNFTDENYLTFINNFSLYTTVDLNERQINFMLSPKEQCTFLSKDSCQNICKSNILNTILNNNDNFSNYLNNIDDNQTNCGTIGFALPDYYKSCLKISKEIGKNLGIYSWFLNYENNSKYDGNIILGIDPHDYNKNKYNIDQYKRVYAYPDDNGEGDDFFDIEPLKYNIYFDKIYFYKNNSHIEENLVSSNGPISKDGLLLFDLGMIQSSYDFFYLCKNYIFLNYTKNNVCSEIIFSKVYHTFVCDKTKLNINDFYKNFPVCYFYQKDFNYTFELSYKDLFKEKNNKIYFMIYTNENNMLDWKFGEIFLKKYFFSYIPDKKMIGFYVPDDIEEKKEEYNYFNIFKIVLIIVLIVIFIAIIGLIGFFIGKKKYDIFRKKRANELIDDNFDYITS